MEVVYEFANPALYKVESLPVKKAFINIENVVASVTLHQNIDLNSIVRVSRSRISS